MSAIDTASRVITWAMAPTGSLPRGDVSLADQLAKPSESLCQLLRNLASLTAARLHFQCPPLADQQPINSDGLVLAAALGMAHIPKVAQIVLQAVSTRTSPADWVTRHGLVEPALTFLSDDLADDFRSLSPLTALFDHPVAEEESTALEVAEQLLAHTVERNAMVQQFAKPTTDTHIRQWRQELLERFRLGSPDKQAFVLDVYEAMMSHHQTDAITQIQSAQAVFTDLQAAKDNQRLEEAISIAQWWGPLWAIERSNRDALRQRRYLGYNYREGLRLYQLSQRLTRGTT